MSLSPRQLKQYHVFLASPGDVGDERQYVHPFIERYNQHTAIDLCNGPATLQELQSALGTVRDAKQQKA